MYNHVFTGLSYRKGTFEDGDNSVVFEVDVMLTDSSKAVVGGEVYLSFGSKISTYVAICNKNVSLQMTGTEFPDLEIEAAVNETDSTA